MVSLNAFDSNFAVETNNVILGINGVNLSNKNVPLSMLSKNIAPILLLVLVAFKSVHIPSLI